MTDIVDTDLRAIADLRADLMALSTQIPALTARLEALTAGNTAIEGQYAEIIELLTLLKAGQLVAPKKAEFVSKRG